VTPTFIPERALAERVLACERNRQSASADEVLVAEEVLRHLRGRLILWFGEDGVRSLVARAISRAELDHPMLADVRSAPHDERQLDRLPSAGGPQLHDALVELVGTLFALLGRLLGMDLVSRTIYQIWPEAALQHLDTPESRTSASE
jgi:hypothetical protein